MNTNFKHIISGLTKSIMMGIFISVSVAGCRKNTEESHVFENVAYLNVSQTRAVQPASFGKVLPSVD